MLGHLETLARAPVLLIACDYDGTLAPIVVDPDKAEANREALVALRMLAEMPSTHVAVISGRALRDLVSRTNDGGAFHLVGSHGSEFEPDFSEALSDDARRLLADITEKVRAIAKGVSNAYLEQKPAAIAFHYRGAGTDAGAMAVNAILAGPGAQAGVQVRHGKMVVELSVLPIDKGAALQRIRQRLGATAVLFIGDDVTDEDAFAALAGADMPVKVGPEPSMARYRISDPESVARLLARVAERRSTWLSGSEAVPIERHALLSDQRTVALVGPTGRVVWLCLPRIDSSAVFAELLGGPASGYFEIRAADLVQPLSQSYIGDSFVLKTNWPGFSVTDYLDASAGRAFQRAGRSDLVRVIEGRGRVLLTFAPRLDFGRNATRLELRDGGVAVDGSLDPFTLFSPGVRWEISSDGPHQTARAIVELTNAGVELDLRYGTGNLDRTVVPGRIRCEQNLRFWQGWVDSLRLPSAAPDMVRRSALVLKGLTYGPTGAIAAAATTSLPESIGGVRNWDYRYCWPRDAAMAARELVRLGSSGSALRLLDWIIEVFESSGPDTLMRPLYTVTGGHAAPEAEIAELAGYRGSRPVRLGNAAAHQIQTDVFGTIAELVAALAADNAPVTPEYWKLLEHLVELVARHWRTPDHGIWELRTSQRRLHVHSSVMCWQTVDRALAVARNLGHSRPRWESLRDEIAAETLERGVSAATGAFGASFEDAAADAASLWTGLSGLLPASDSRFISTVELVERALLRDSVVCRYCFDDGLPGAEAGFNLCTTWLIEAYARMERHDAAHELFERYVGLAGPTGLLSEQYSPETGTALGNFPQVYSHLGLIRAAAALERELMF